jgi:hypothetical protein
MSITYELLEEFTGTRTTEMLDMENEGETITEESPCTDIQVRFTCTETNKTHERSVNVCLDADGAYDAEATLVRVGEVAMGVGHKIACGVIS